MDVQKQEANVAMTKEPGTKSKNGNIAHWSKPEQLELLRGWARDGYTNTDIAEKIGVSEQTLRAYCKKNEEIREAIREGKEVIDFQVEDALLRAARGAKTKEVRVLTTFYENKLWETQKEVIEKEHPPNVAACTAWLFNRKPEKWKRNPENNMNLDDDRSINITITRAGNSIEVTEDGDEQDCEKSSPGV